MKMISRCGALLLILCLITALLPLPASAGTYDIFTYEINDGKVTITGCAPNISGKVVIPDTIEGCPVTTIGEKAFYQQTKITEVILPDTVKTVEGYGFGKCTNMASIKLSEKLTNIKIYAFYDCDSLISLHFPAGSSIHSASAFSSCDNLTYLTVDEGNKNFYSIDNCVIFKSSKTLVLGAAASKIPSDGSVERIESHAFDCRNRLTHIDIPEGVTKVNTSAFWGCANLSSIHLSATVTNFAVQTNVYGLSTLTVDPDNPVYHSQGNCIIETGTKTLIQGTKDSKIPTDGSVTTIGINAFADARGLTTITIPEGITTINGSAFTGCNNLANISLPSTLETVNRRALYSTALTEITFPVSVSYIGNNCTIYSRKLKSVTILNPYAQIDGEADTFYGDVTIRGYTGSTAEAYAKEYGKTFVSIGTLHTCTYNQKVATGKYLSTAASCTAPAAYFYSCTCGEKGAKTFTQGDVLAHTYDNDCDSSCNICKATRTAPHTYTSAWKFNDRVHWHECTCGAKSGEATHTWDLGTVTEKPTETENGTLLFTCTICSVQRTEDIAPTPGVTEPTVPTEPAPTEPAPTEPAPTEPTVPNSTEPTVQTQTNPPETTAPTVSEAPVPQDKNPSLIWIIPVALLVIGLAILIIFLLKRKKEKE